MPTMGIQTDMRATQAATLSPRLQQSLKLLQMSAPELEEAIAQALDANPLLQADGSPPGEAGPAEADRRAPPQLPWPSRGARAEASDGEDALASLPAPSTLREHLLGQLAASPLSARDAALARLVVEALDEDGYLRDPLDDLRAFGGSATADASAGDLEIALRFVQSLEPAGVGARSVGECLRLQLLRRDAGEPGRSLALRIVDGQLELLAAHDTAALVRVLGCSEVELAQADRLIRSLAPRPAVAFGGEAPRYVIPEVAVRCERGRWVAVPNRDAYPRLCIDRWSSDALRRVRGWSATPLGARLVEARWLLRSLEQRRATILAVAAAIVDAQQAYFEHGDIAIRPLHLRDIAARLGVHESTVSRVIAGKYMATPHGTIGFRHFFGSRLADDEGGRVSPRAVRSLIRDIVAGEDPRAPLSDIRIARILERGGVAVARRTVSKYRAEAGIPPVEARRLAALGEAAAAAPTRAARVSARPARRARMPSGGCTAFSG